MNGSRRRPRERSAAAAAAAAGDDEEKLVGPQQNLKEKKISSIENYFGKFQSHTPND